MSHSIYMAYAGMQGHAQALELISHNLANIQSTGFKQQKFYQELLEGMDDEQLSELGAAINNPQMRARVATDFSGGIVHQTGNDLDFALLGDGFFSVLTPEGVRYTRNGDFSLGQGGRLVTPNGYPVLGVGDRPEGTPIVLPDGKLQVGSDGRMTVDGTEVGQLRVVAFQDSSSLELLGGSLFKAKPGVQEVPPSLLNVGQGYLEQSNVSAIKAVTEMVSLMRNFELLSQSIRSLTRDVDQKLINEVGRV
jgi:flagellar basal-body rod protein FlgG